MPNGNSGEEEFYAMRGRLSMVMRCHEELDTNVPINPEHFKSHPYAEDFMDQRSLEFALAVETDSLCNTLGSISDDDMRDFSLDLQVWWRDHQAQEHKRQENDGENAYTTGGES